MSRDDEDRFRPRPGRIRSDGRGGAATKSFFTRVRKIARQHGAGPPGASASRKSGGSGGRARGKVGVRRGGATWARRCLRPRPRLGRTRMEPPSTGRPGASWSSHAPSVPPGKNGRAAAHLRYIQRDGTSRDGERGGCIRRRRTGPTAMPSSIAARTTATSFASSSRLRTAQSSRPLWLHPRPHKQDRS